jgi:uncharacterized membrane protein
VGTEARVLKTQGKSQGMNAIRLMAASAIWFVPDAPVLGQIPCSYEISHIIQAPPCPWTGPPATTGTGISPDGHYVCGFYAQCEGYTESFVYDTTTAEFFTLPRPKGVISSTAADVNDAGQVVGQYEHTIQGKYLGYIYDLNSGEYTELPPQPGGAWAAATAINSSSTVCGWRSINDGGDPAHPWNAFIWSPKDGFTDLGVMNGPNSSAFGINSAADACGWTGASAPAGIAFVHKSGVTTLLGPVPDGISSRANAIRDDCVVVGSGRKRVNGSLTFVPYVHDEDGFHLLPILPEFTRGSANYIHSSGLIVGNSSRIETSGVVFRACIWSDLKVVDLRQITNGADDLVFEGAGPITASGHILVDGILDPGSEHVALIVQPIGGVIGDANCDNVVNVDDLLAVINAWGPCYGCAEDFTEDSKIDTDDLLLTLNNWTLEN